MFKDRKPVQESQKKPEVLLEWRGIDQARIALGVRAYNIFHPARFTQGLLATILGGMMSSRLFIEVRDKLGLAYDVGMTSEEDPDSGFLLTRAGVTPSNAEKAIRVILREYKKIARFPVPVKELNKAKEHIKGQMALNLEPSEEKASFYGVQELLQKKVLTPGELYGRIKNVRAGDVRRIAQELFVNNRLNLALLGPFKEKKQFEKLLRL
jgi:predicted Zn-dependent peptidase